MKLEKLKGGLVDIILSLKSVSQGQTANFLGITPSSEDGNEIKQPMG